VQKYSMTSAIATIVITTAIMSFTVLYLSSKLLLLLVKQARNPE
jgi:hypothetical protein